MSPMANALRRNVRLNHSVEILIPQRSIDGSGEDIESAPEVSIGAYAEVLPASSREVFFAQQVHMEVTHVLRMDVNTNLVPENRIRWTDGLGQHTVEIVGVRNLHARSIRVELMCREITT